MPVAASEEVRLRKRSLRKFLRACWVMHGYAGYAGYGCRSKLPLIEQLWTLEIKQIPRVLRVEGCVRTPLLSLKSGRNGDDIK